MSVVGRVGAVVGGVALVAAMAGGPVSAAGAVRWVDDDGRAGPSTCAGTRAVPKKVQPAVTAANAGDTIRLCPGTYTGFVAITKRGLTIAATAAGGVTLRAPADRTRSQLVNIEAADVTIRGMRLLVPAGAKDGSGCALPTLTGIRTYQARNLTLRNNRIVGDETTASRDCGLEWGMHIERTSGTISDNVIRNHVNTGMDVYNSTGLTISENKIQHVHPAAAGDKYTQGILVNKSTVTVADNVIETVTGTADQMDVGMTADYSTTVLFQRNTVTGASTGLIITGTADGVIEDNTFSDGSIDGIFLSNANDAPTSPSVILRRNVVTGFDGRGIFSAASSGLSIRFNDFSGNGDVDCQEYTDPTEHSWVGNKSSEASDPVGLCAPENAGPP